MVIKINTFTKQSAPTGEYLKMSCLSKSNGTEAH